MARERGWRVLACRPVQSEAALSFSALADLLEPVPGEVLAGLPGPQRLALDVALLRAGPGPQPPDQRAVAVALLGVLRELAETSPVVVGVDDLPWLDRASAAVLGYALRRLTTQRAGLLATIPPGTATMAGQPQRWLPPGRTQALPVGPLSTEALSAMLRARDGAADQWPEVAAVVEASGGNPFVALELAAAVGRMPCKASIWRAPRRSASLGSTRNGWPQGREYLVETLSQVMHRRETVVQAQEGRRAVGGEHQRAQDQIRVLPQPQRIIRAEQRSPAMRLARQRAKAARHPQELSMSDR